jgi:hypothetical protein
MSAFTEIEFAWCQSYLEKLMNHPLAISFLHPVDPERDVAPDYFRVITQPMDLGTIHAKLTNREYQTSAEFFGDLDLVWSNALTYNKKGLLHEFAKFFRPKCEAESRRLPKTKMEEWNRKLAKTQKKISALLALPFPGETLLPRHPDYSDNKSFIE